jgi:hypothetical protein
MNTLQYEYATGSITYHRRALASLHPEVAVCLGRAAGRPADHGIQYRARYLLSSLPCILVRTVHYCCQYYSIELYVTSFVQGSAQLRKLPDREAGPRGPPREKSIPELRPATHGGFSVSWRHGYPALVRPARLRVVRATRVQGGLVSLALVRATWEMHSDTGTLHA